MGKNPRGSRSSDGIMKQTKEKGNKGGLEVVWNKELKWGSGLEADLYGTRLEGDITTATWIGNHVKIGNSSGIDWEWRQLLDHKGESYAGAEGRQNKQDSNQKP